MYFYWSIDWFNSILFMPLFIYFILVQQYERRCLQIQRILRLYYLDLAGVVTFDCHAQVSSLDCFFSYCDGLHYRMNDNNEWLCTSIERLDCGRRYFWPPLCWRRLWFWPWPKKCLGCRTAGYERHPKYWLVKERYAICTFVLSSVLSSSQPWSTW